MKIKELIEILSKKNPDMRVVVSGYESGYDELDSIQEVEITANPDADIKTWEGDFDEVNLKIPFQKFETALYLPRKS
jgi:hypothetical protein